MEQSKLRLPALELKLLYTRHLLLETVLLKELSLYILSISLVERKQKAFIFYEQNADKSSECLLLLESLEDRFVNGIVSYRIGFCLQNYDFYRNAYNIFKDKLNLSPIELFYLAAIYKDGKGGINKNIQEALRLYKLSADSGYFKAMINLGCAYRDGDGVDKNNEIAVTYFEKAVSINSREGKCHLAYMLEFGHGINKNIDRSNELYIDAAKDGDKYSIERCKILNIKCNFVY